MRQANDRDFRGFGRRDPPERWSGVVALDGRRRVAMGNVVWDGRGRAWCFFDAKRRVSALIMHRTAKRVIEQVRAAGQSEMWAACHHHIPGADVWLARLGFRPSGETVAGFEAWVLK